MSYSPPPAQVAASCGFVHAPWRWIDRLAVIGAGGLLLALLAIAIWLPPSPTGLGTHRQLGLPACTLLNWFGVRCPSCGMTTAWSCLVRGQIVSALRANAGGVLLAVSAMAAGPWLVASGLCGRWIGGLPRDSWVIAAAVLVLVTTLTQWTVRLSLGW